MTPRQAFLGLVIVAAGAACTRSEDPADSKPATEQAQSKPDQGPFPLFSGLAEEMRKLDEARPPGQKSKAPEEINWAPNIYAAIERATAENKPIFVSVHVRENADPSGDV